MINISARELVECFGEELIGRRIMTPKCGSYPGGIATVVSIYPDPEAPDIVCEVENEHWIDDDGINRIGILDYEECGVRIRISI